eukprot:CAMPEP_0173443314 /NCGR_PEP_ID=MMETSP1357-20121228/29411_1 /TAXON_ID=77926 /ORGANISM="Hemiselmis rufescens, Strain PCC563" /LENGTH=89 /DNA_ID=CAMNT_0014409177 /DNA_START=321 /DNA_END=587 /DNA_ORIENTATION=-
MSMSGGLRDLPEGDDEEAPACACFLCRGAANGLLNASSADILPPISAGSSSSSSIVACAFRRLSSSWIVGFCSTLTLPLQQSTVLPMVP